MIWSEEAVHNRRQYLKHFAVSLMRPHLQARSVMKYLPADIQCALAKYKPLQVDVIDEQSLKVRKRCQFCKRAKNSVATKTCSSCNDFVGKEHSVTYVQCNTSASYVMGEWVMRNVTMYSQISFFKLFRLCSICF